MASLKRSRSRPSGSSAVLAQVRKYADKALYQKARDANVQDLRNFQQGLMRPGTARKHQPSQVRVSKLTLRKVAPRSTEQHSVHA